MGMTSLLVDCFAVDHLHRMWFRVWPNNYGGELSAEVVFAPVVSAKDAKNLGFRVGGGMKPSLKRMVIDVLSLCLDVLRRVPPASVATHSAPLLYLLTSFREPPLAVVSDKTCPFPSLCVLPPSYLRSAGRHHHSHYACLHPSTQRHHPGTILG